MDMMDIRKICPMLILDLIHHMQISIEVHRKTGLSWLELMGLLGDDVTMSVPRRDEGVP